MLPSAPGSAPALSPPPGAHPVPALSGFSSAAGLDTSESGHARRHGSNRQDPERPPLQDHITATDLEAVDVIGGATVDIDSHEKASALLADATRLDRLQGPAPLFAAPNILEQHVLAETAQSQGDAPSSSAATILLCDAITRDKALDSTHMDATSILAVGA